MYYTKSARFYDALYAVLGKDYAEEARYVHTIVQRHKRSAGNTLVNIRDKDEVGYTCVVVVDGTS